MPRDRTEFHRSETLGGLEILSGSFGGATFPRHCHEEYVICLMTDGAEKLKVRGASQDVSSGSLLVIEPGEWHSNSGFEICRYISIYPSTQVVNRFAALLELPAPPTLGAGQRVLNDRPDMRRTLANLFNSVKTQEDPLEQETHFMSFVHALLSGPCHPATKTGKCGVPSIAVRTVKDKIDAEFETKLSLADISSASGLSPYHLLRTFSDHVGITPHQYVTHRRIAEAKKLLRQGIPAGHVALNVGFADQSHLHRHFTRIVGVTPGRFAR